MDRDCHRPQLGCGDTKSNRRPSPPSKTAVLMEPEKQKLISSVGVCVEILGGAVQGRGSSTLPGYQTSLRRGVPLLRDSTLWSLHGQRQSSKERLMYLVREGLKGLPH